MRTILFLFLLISSQALFAQVAPGDFKEGTPVTIEGIEFSYRVGGEEVKMIDGTQYSFYNVDWTIANKGKFSKVFLLAKESLVENPEYDMTKRAYLAKIYVENGLQSPATKKFDVISAEPNTEIVSYSKRIIGTKRNMNQGFNLQPGQTLNSSITVGVKKGDKPVVVLYPLLSKCY